MQILNTNQGYNFSNFIKPSPNIVSLTFPALCVKHACLFGHNGKHCLTTTLNVSQTMFVHLVGALFRMRSAMTAVFQLRKCTHL